MYQKPDTLIRGMLRVSLRISLARKYKHTHTRHGGPCAFSLSPSRWLLCGEPSALQLQRYESVFHFPIISDQRGKLSCQRVYESDRHPRGLRHPAFKHAASVGEGTKARDQTDIPSGERLFYMHWATVMENSSGEGNQTSLGRDEWRAYRTDRALSVQIWNSVLIAFFLFPS